MTPREPYHIMENMKQIKLSNTTDCMLVDDEDYPVLSRFTWHKTDTGYAMTSVDGKRMRAHLMVMGSRPKKLVCDHKNRNKLDNRKKNLRWTTPKANANNKDTVGICWDKSRNKWLVRYKNKFYGRYTSRREAEKVFRDAKSGKEYIANPRPVNRLLPKNIFRQCNKFGYGITIDGVLYRKNGFDTVAQAVSALNKLKTKLLETEDSLSQGQKLEPKRLAQLTEQGMGKTGIKRLGVLAVVSADQKREHLL